MHEPIRFESIAFPLTEPVNSYFIPDLNLLIDAGIEYPRVEARTIYITHWHWDHVLGLVGAPEDIVVCMSRATLDVLKTRRYEERVRSVLEAGGVKLGELEKVFLEEMRRRYERVVDALGRLDVRILDEDCPLREHVGVLDCPGHSVDHVCYIIGGYAFVGDTILPGSRSTIIDFRSHRESIMRLMLRNDWRVLMPGHGPSLRREEIFNIINNYVNSRCSRVFRVLAEIARGANDIGTLLRRVYGLEPSLASFVAIRTIIGYLAELEAEGIVRVDKSVSPWRVWLA